MTKVKIQELIKRHEIIENDLANELLSLGDEPTDHRKRIVRILALEADILVSLDVLLHTVQ